MKAAEGPPLAKRDFTRCNDPDAYQKALDRLLRDLRVEGVGSQQMRGVVWGDMQPPDVGRF